MTNDKNANAPAAASSKTNKSHSKLFYISNTLFENKRLKLKRLKFLELRKKLARGEIAPPKTEPRKWNVAIVNKTKKAVPKWPQVAEVIDLLSDEEEPPKPAQQQKATQQSKKAKPQLLTATHSTPLKTSNQQVNNHKANNNVAKINKNKRKKANCTLVNPLNIVDSITILSDEEEQQETKQVPAKKAIKVSQPSTIFSAQVDEEVSVSLVPRTKASGSCQDERDGIFPMLPEETTVHTVIANRTYELPLAKLREGLAVCGVPEFASEAQHKVTGRKNSFAPPANITNSAPSPPAFKLCSDLSISLISDDDEDESHAKVSPSRAKVPQPRRNGVHAKKAATKVVHKEEDEELLVPMGEAALQTLELV